jgi:hypothetical protein
MDGRMDHIAGIVDAIFAFADHLPSRSTFTRLEAVISSKVRPKGLIRK